MNEKYYLFEVYLKDVEGSESWYSFPIERCALPEVALARGKRMYPSSKIRVIQIDENNVRSLMTIA
jgi:hypothetical protein